jgi:hypothetical protein
LAILLTFKKSHFQQEDQRAKLKKKSIFENLAKKEAEKENKGLLSIIINVYYLLI